MQQITQNWQEVFIGFSIFGILLFLLFRLLQYVVPFLFKNKKILNKAKRILPIIETASWLAFFSWYTIKFYAQYNVYTIVVLVIILVLAFWISRFLIRELIAGVVFRISARFYEGDLIQSYQHAGTIKKFHFDVIELEASDGQIVYIPYSKLSGEVTIKNESAGQTSAFSFQLLCKDTSEPDFISEKIKTFLLSLPWSSVSTQPHISLIEHNDKHYTFDVTCYPVDKSYAKKIEQKVLDKFGE